MSDVLAVSGLLDSLMHPELKEIDLSLGRIERFLSEIGNPQLKLPPVIHVAGTNGKGSTIAFMRSILEAAGKTVHVYTSPHLVHFRERIVVAGEVVADDVLVPLLGDIKEHTKSLPLTFFEATTVAAFQLFSEHKADYTLLEVGMGGRFDATNVVPQPAVSVITPVSMDHAEYLGDSLAGISFEKASIIKPGVPVVVAPQEQEAKEVIDKMAESLSSRCIHCEADEKLPVSLPGEHQLVNAAVAIAALRQVEGVELSPEAIERGLNAAVWPARLQRLNAGPLVKMLPRDWSIWLDGGHNAAAGKVLAAWCSKQTVPIHLICAMVDRKDAKAFLAPLAPCVTSAYAVGIEDEPQSMDKTRLSDCAESIGLQMVDCEFAGDALGAVLQRYREDEGIVLICGSLYLAGRVLEKNS